MFNRFKKKSHKNILLEELNLTCLALECANSRFDYASDPDLIDSSIYEFNAAQKKYKYLLSQIKALN